MGGGVGGRGGGGRGGRCNLLRVKTLIKIQANWNMGRFKNAIVILLRGG